MAAWLPRLEMTVRYASSFETHRVPTGELTGSMVRSYAERIWRVHAVRVRDGKPAPKTVCHRDAGSVSEKDWEPLHPLRCDECYELFGLLGLPCPTPGVVDDDTPIAPE